MLYGKSLYVTKQLVDDLTRHPLIERTTGERHVGLIEARRHGGLLQRVTHCSLEMFCAQRRGMYHLHVLWWRPN